MKKIAILCCITLAFLSCSSDDDSTNGGDDNGNLELGIYRLTSFETVSSFDFDGDGDSSNDLLIETGCLQNERLVFTDGNLVASISSSSLDIFVEIDTDSGELTQIVDCVEEEDSVVLAFEVNGNDISIIDGTTVLIAGVISGDQLIFEVPEGFIFETIESGVTVTLTETAVLTYTFQL